MRLLWGLWTVKMWGYYDAYTAAQIELLAVDCPITVYDHGKGKDGKGGKSELPDVSAKDIMEAGNRWKEKYKEGAGVTLDLSEYKTNMK